MKKITFVLMLTVLTTLCLSQSVLVIVNGDSKIYLDGEEKGKVNADDALKIPITKGEHYIQAKGIWNGQQKETHKTIKIESDEQTIVKLSFGDESSKEPQTKEDSSSIVVADLNFKLPGTITVSQWKSDNPGKEYPDNPLYYYAFEKGDDIVVNFKNSGDATNKILIFSYPGKEIKYSSKSFTELKNIHIKVEQRCIYMFSLSTNHAFSTSGELVIKRIPASSTTKDFNTNVNKVKTYKPVCIQPTQEFTVHSMTHIGEGSRETIPVNLPANTIEWFYKFGASRDKAQIDASKGGLKLFEELASLCGPEGKVLATGVDLLSTPPGTNNCNVYLLNEENHLAFENNKPCNYIEEGTRTSLMYGKVQLKSAIGQTFYLGFDNPSTFYSINVIIEVVAITQKVELIMEQQ